MCGSDGRTFGSPSCARRPVRARTVASVRPRHRSARGRCRRAANVGFELADGLEGRAREVLQGAQVDDQHPGGRGIRRRQPIGECRRRRRRSSGPLYWRTIGSLDGSVAGRSSLNRQPWSSRVARRRSTLGPARDDERDQRQRGAADDRPLERHGQREGQRDGEQGPRCGAGPPGQPRVRHPAQHQLDADDEQQAADDGLRDLAHERAEDDDQDHDRGGRDVAGRRGWSPRRRRSRPSSTASRRWAWTGRTPRRHCPGPGPGSRARSWTATRRGWGMRVGSRRPAPARRARPRATRAAGSGPWSGPAASRDSGWAGRRVRWGSSPHRR